jgi:hypothetical protein
MELIFEETANRYQCGCEFTVNDLRMHCTFSTSRIVKIPKGLSYANGKLEVNETVLGSTLSICRNHEGRLKNAYDELFKKV